MQSKAHQDASARYNAKAYTQIQIRVKKGKKEIIEEYANKAGASINNYINNAIDRQLIKDGYKPEQAAREGEQEENTSDN